MTTTTTNITNITESTPRICAGVTASGTEWQAAGCGIYRNTLDVTLPHDFDKLLLAGRLATGADDWRVLAWAVRERQRQAEERTRSTAVARLAESLRNMNGSVTLDADPLIAAIDKMVSALRP